MTERKPYAITVQDLVERGRDDIPAELITSTHLIYNSPAALAFNSPGAQGFGVKRAGLSSWIGYAPRRSGLLRPQYDHSQ